MEKINIAELLKDCPKGMELDCTAFNNVKFQCADNDGIWIEYIDSDNNNRVLYLTCYGGIKINNIETKCVIFQKGKTTWEGFVPPCNFKDGDILYCNANDDGEDKDMFKYIFIFDKIVDGRFYYSHCHLFGSEFYDTKTNLVHDYSVRFATEEEKQKLFQAIKNNGYKWNAETKTLEKLPSFKVGDRITFKCEKDKPIISITGVKDNYYLVQYFNIIKGDYQNAKISFEFQDNYELIPDKFNINTLVPFESRVLVRDYGYSLWQPSLWGLYDRGHMFPYITIGGRYKQCIPYKDNEHLLGTANDCDEYFKTWK